MLGFIFMVDAFQIENGSTIFLPGSQVLTELTDGTARSYPDEQHACGPAGSMILFDGSIWHGHGPNLTGSWRRSVQGALIPKRATGAVNYPATLPPHVWAGFLPIVRSLLGP